MKLVACAIAAAALLACGRGTPTFCESYADRVMACGPAELPHSLRGQIVEYCDVTRAYTPAPQDGSDNLAVISKRALEACEPSLACPEFLKCIAAHCRLVTMSPTGPFSYDCMQP